jgi:hypothetical protein
LSLRPHGHALPVASQFPSHRAVLAAVVSLECETTVGPQLALGTETFLPSAYRPQQSVCSQPECQRRRRTDYHRKKLATDAEYHQVALESQKQWREEHPDLLCERLVPKFLRRLFQRHTT